MEYKKKTATTTMTKKKRSIDLSKVQQHFYITWRLIYANVFASKIVNFRCAKYYKNNASRIKSSGAIFTFLLLLLTFGKCFFGKCRHLCWSQAERFVQMTRLCHCFLCWSSNFSAFFFSEWKSSKMSLF